MDIKDISSNSLSFIGDAVFTLAVRKYFIENNYQSSKSLQNLCNGYNSAKGQSKVFNRLNNECQLRILPLNVPLKYIRKIKGVL